MIFIYKKCAQILYFVFSLLRSSHPEVPCEKGVLRILTKFTRKHLHQSLFFKKETLVQVFSCQFCDISINAFSYRTPLVAASDCCWSTYITVNNLAADQVVSILLSAEQIITLVSSKLSVSFCSFSQTLSKISPAFPSKIEITMLYSTRTTGIKRTYFRKADIIT